MGGQHGLAVVDVHEPFKPKVVLQIITSKHDQTSLTAAFENNSQKLLVTSCGIENRVTEYAFSVRGKLPKLTPLRSGKLPKGFVPWDVASVRDQQAVVTFSGQTDIAVFSLGACAPPRNPRARCPLLT